MARKTKTEEKPARKPRKVAGVDYDPAEVYNYCIENQPIGVTQVAEHFDINPTSVKAVVLDFCAMNSQIPPRFASRGAVGSGLVKVRALKLSGERGDENREAAPGSGVQLIVGNAYLSTIGAAHNDTLKVEVDKENGAITLTLERD